MPTPPSIHQICRAGFDMRMARNGDTEDDIAREVNAMHGSDLTGADFRAMHTEGYSTHVLDMVSATVGQTTLALINQTVQMATSGPHSCCPTCTCGTTESERRTLAAQYLSHGQEAGAAMLRAIRAEQVTP